MAGIHTRRSLEHRHPDDGPLDDWLASWAARGMVPEYPWDSTPITVNGRTVLPYTLIDDQWLAEHPGWMSGLASEERAVGGDSGGHARHGRVRC